MSWSDQGGPGTPDLNIGADALRRLSGHADTQVEEMTEIVGDLHSDEHRSSTEPTLADLESAVAMGRVRASWERRLADLLAECRRLQEEFHLVATGFEGTETEIEGLFRREPVPREPGGSL
ncbi:hypothetical protein [Streptomyces specialis]|uniref:hypothetical protein n=1 Tax=Streptomyces specialis TaxID=498367 RepID=UPI00073F3191|nr:hypothetical protein [Streptomyces specialis]